MSSLSIIPIEILEWITSVVTTSEQMRLWQCGDRILNRKLSNGSLKRTSLRWSYSSWMPWPRSYFTVFGGLEEVEWDVSIGISLCPSLEFNLLPPTLKSLHLACDDVFVLLRKQNINMNKLLPLLHTLRLSGSRLCEENLKNLPSSLVELHVTSPEDIQSPNIFRDLPRSIQRLKLSFSVKDESELENDLPELISLEIHYIYADFNWFSKLPTYLKILKITGIDFYPLWLNLPRQLEELEYLSTSYLLEASMLPHLPQTLRTLKLSKILHIDDEIGLISILPKNLTRIELQLQGEQKPIGQLPVSLTDFEVDVSAGQPGILSFFHPETIRISMEGELIANFTAFPPKLQFLTIHRIDDYTCAMLPSGLQKIWIESGLITTKGASKLPKSLDYLVCPFQVFDSNEAISYLGHLSSVRLFEVTKLDENWLSSLLPSSSSSSSEQGNGSDMANSNDCNHHLTSLLVAGSRRTPQSFMTKSFFDSLPKFRNLRKLQITNFDCIEGAWFVLIPQNVTELEIRSLKSFPTAVDLSSLPKCLRYLDLHIKLPKEYLQCHWNDDIFQSLPRSLQKFTINGSAPNLTNRAYEYLPDNLQKLSMTSEAFRFLTPLTRMYGEFPK